MKVWLALALALGAPAALGGQAPAAGEPVAVITDHPRLFLTPARLRLLQRERERGSERWQRLDELAASGASLPEPGFALALHYRVSGSQDSGRRAVAWALGQQADPRQMALVFDWCQNAMTAAQKAELTARLARALAALGDAESVLTMRTRALAAVALYDEVADAPARELQRVVGTWWNGQAAPALGAGQDAIPREDVYALFELLHAIRDSANVDLRQACPPYFRQLPFERLLSYYPAVFQSPENDFRVAARAGFTQPDLRSAALARAADLAMVDYDPNLDASQYLQGWIARDRFILRGPFGAPYEFLWANPYQPGLNYFLAPLAYHDDASGELFVRSDWQDSAIWIGWFGGVAQEFSGGRLTPLNPHAPATIDLGSGVVSFGAASRQFVTAAAEGERAYVAALDPKRVYQVEIEGKGSHAATADSGGVLEVALPPGKKVEVRIRPARP